MFIIQVFLIIIALLTFFITLFVYRGRKDAVRQSFLLLGAGLSYWITSLVLLQTTRNFIFSNPILFAALLSSGGLFFLSKTFPDYLGVIPRRFYLYLIPAFIVAILIQLNLVVEGAIFHPDGASEPILGPAFPIFMITVFVYSIASLFIIVRKLRKSTGIVREQMKYLSWGLGISFLIILVADTLLPALGIHQFNVLGGFAPIIFVGFTAYAIVRHQLMDIHVVIQRGLLYALAIVIATVLYLTFIFTLGRLFSQTTEATPFFSAIIVAIIAIIGFPYFEKFFQKITDRLFFKGSYDYYEALRDLSRILSSTLDLDKLVYSIDSLIRKTLRVDRTVFLLRGSNGDFKIVNDTNFEIHKEISRKEFRMLMDIIIDEAKVNGVVVCQDLAHKIRYMPYSRKEKRLYEAIVRISKQAKASIIVPIFSKRKVTAMFILGEKLSGDVFAQKDIELLNILSQQAGVAIENAQLYEEIRDYSKYLEKRVKTRTSELRRLYNTQSKFMADVSHQLQSPLAIIKGNLGLIRGGSSGKKNTDEALNSIDGALDRVSNFINDLLTLAKADSGQQKFKKEVVELNNFIRDIYEQFNTSIEDSGIGFNLQEGEKLTILGDRERLRDLFLNLVINATKYTPKGGKIEVKLYREDDWAKVEIKDTGIGISKKDLPHIFERFYQAEHMGDISSVGIGLGLAICAWVVKAHKGTITVQSELGKGSTFTVSIPIHRG